MTLAKKDISVLIFTIAILLYFYIDFTQEWYVGDFRKLYVFNGRNIVQAMIGVSIGLNYNRVFSVLAYGWAAYNLENIYYRMFNGSSYELRDWIISVGLIFIVCMIKLIRWKKWFQV